MPSQLAAATTDQFVRAGVEAMAPWGYTPLTHAECAVARQMAADLIGGGASLASLQAARLRQANSSFGYREDGEITGLIGFLCIGQRGFEAILEDRFDAANLDLSLLSAADETPVLAYGWGVACTTKVASRASMGASHALSVSIWSSVPFITRAVTPVGRHVSLTRAGYEPLRGPDDNLLIRRARKEMAA